MEIGLLDQLLIFFFSLMFGAALRLLLDIFKFIELILSYKKTRFIVRDITYFSLCGVLSFLFLLSTTKGEFKAFIILGESLGWITYHLTIGKVSSHLIKKASRIIAKISSKIKTLICPAFSFALSKLKMIYNKIKLYIHNKKTKLHHRPNT